MKLKYLISFAFFAGYFAKSQTVTPTVYSINGGYSQGSGGAIYWTIGEPVSDTYSTSTNITTMGFHQPAVINVKNMIEEHGAQADILVYPNPVVNDVNVNFSGLKNGTYNLEITDAIGKQLYRSKTDVSADHDLATLKLGEYANGAYFLNIKGQSFQKTIKLIKTN